MKTSIIMMILLIAIVREAYMKPEFKFKQENQQQPEPNTTTEAIITTTESMESLLNRYIEHTFGKDPFPGDWSQLQAIGIEHDQKEKQPNGEVKRQPLTITIGMKQPMYETRRKRLVLNTTDYGSILPLP